MVKGRWNGMCHGCLLHIFLMVKSLVVTNIISTFVGNKNKQQSVTKKTRYNEKSNGVCGFRYRRVPLLDTRLSRGSVLSRTEPAVSVVGRLFRA